MNECKVKLSEKLEEAAWLRDEVENKRLILGKLEKEGLWVEKETRSEAHVKSRLRQSIDEVSEMPDVEDYILQKKEMYDLETKVKNWEKKVEIMEMAARRSRTIAGKQMLSLT